MAQLVQKICHLQASPTIDASWFGKCIHPEEKSSLLQPLCKSFCSHLLAKDPPNQKPLSALGMQWKLFPVVISLIVRGLPRSTCGWHQCHTSLCIKMLLESMKCFIRSQAPTCNSGSAKSLLSAFMGLLVVSSSDHWRDVYIDCIALCLLWPVVPTDAIVDRKLWVGSLWNW